MTLSPYLCLALVHRVKVLATHMRRQSHSSTQLHMHSTHVHKATQARTLPHVYTCNRTCACVQPHTQLHARGVRAHRAYLELPQGTPRVSQETSDGSHHCLLPQPVWLVITATETGIGLCAVKSRPLCRDFIPLVWYGLHLPIPYFKC